MRKKLARSLGLCLACAAAALGLWASGLLDLWEARTWDWRVGLLARPGPATDRIRLILLDQPSLDWGSRENGLSWPWPREMYAAVIRFCERSGAKALAFDVLSTEPSSYGVEDDRQLGEAAASFGRLAASVFLGEESGSSSQWPASARAPNFEVTGLESWLAGPGRAAVSRPRAAMPVDELARNAAVLADVALQPDEDGVYRRLGLFSVFDGRFVPNLGPAAFLAAHPGQKIRLAPGRLALDGLRAPLDASGKTLLRYRGPTGTHQAFSAAAVIQSEIRLTAGEPPVIDGEKAFKDKYVFFGFSAPGLYDLRPAPVGGVFSGVEIYATALDNLLSGDFMRAVPAGLIAVLAAVLALAAGLTVSLLGGAAANLGASVLFLLIPVGLSFGLYAAGFWLPVVVQELGVASALGLTLIVNYATEGRQKRFIKSAFSQYLSPAVIEQLIRQPDRLKLGGERRELSIFFSDLQGFTSISENLAPEDLTTLLNEYLTAMTEIIQAEGGTVDKYEGDAIMAFWNAPLAVDRHAERAVRSALACQETLAGMRPGLKPRIHRDLYMRIGVHTGPAVVGNFGSHTRFNYTLLGDSVNLASRLEGVNKQFGTYTMISKATRDQVGEVFSVRELGRVAVVGRREPVTVFEPMSHEVFQERARVYEGFGQGLGRFYQGDFSRALEIFSALAADDPAAAAYAAKCKELLEVRPADWQGVWTMTTK
jgi:adenylate cyclase